MQNTCSAPYQVWFRQRTQGFGSLLDQHDAEGQTLIYTPINHYLITLFKNMQIKRHTRE
jgi:hypothetical protein